MCGSGRGHIMNHREDVMRLRNLPLLAILFVLGASAAQAQWSSSDTGGRGIEITPFGGSRFGGVIDTNPGPTSTIDYLAIRSTWDYGGWLDVDLVPRLQAEFMWNRQPTVLGAHDFTTDTTSRVGQANLDMYQFGLLVDILHPESRIQPYIAGGLGFTNWDTHGLLPFNNTFAYNIGGGVKLFFNRHIGLRFDARYSPTRTTESDEEFCDFFGCGLVAVPNYAHQGQANLGVIFRF
jgi:hypothetical protein